MKILRSLLATALLAATVPALADPQVPLRIIGINDFHGNLESDSLSLSLADPEGAGPDAKPLRVPVGGAAALAGMVKALRAGADNSLVLSAGDLIGASPLPSTLFRHESTIAVMNRIGVDVNVTGNHEYDAGAAELKRVARGGCGKPQPRSPAESCADGPYKGAAFPFIVSNVVDAKGHAFMAPYVIRKVEGVKVGIIGAVTRTTPSIVVPSGIAGLKFQDEAVGINRAARQLRKQGVRTLIAVLHEGGEIGPPAKRGDWNDPKCEEKHGPIWDIAHRLDKDIRILMTAHTHQGYRCEFEGRLLIQGTSYGRGVSVVDVVLDPRTGRLVPSSVRSINLPVLNDKTPPEMREKLASALPAPYSAVLRDARPDAEIATMVAHYAGEVAPKADRAVGRIEGPFLRGGLTDSTAGRLLADAQLAATRSQGAQMAFMNPGGIRSNLECAAPPCTVTYGQAFSMQPFGNGLVVMTLTGTQVKVLLESQQMRPDGEPTILQPSAGFKYTWHSGARRGEKVHDMKLDGQPIKPDARYRVTVNGFIAEGGDGFVLLKDGRERTGGGDELQALIDYLAAAPRTPDPTPRMNRVNGP